MPSRRESIVAAQKAALSAAFGGPTVWRGRAAPLSRGEFPAVVLEKVKDGPGEEFNTKTDWRMTVRVAILVRSETPDQTADPMEIIAHNTMTATPTWGGLAVDTEAGNVDWELLDADVTTGIVSMLFHVHYRTSQTDITVP